MNVHEFVQKQLELLEEEHAAEIEESRCLQETVSLAELQRRGICLQKLGAVSFWTGLFGRSCIDFGPYWPGKPLASHSLSNGDIVGVGTSSSGGRKMLATGVVFRVAPSSITVAFDEKTDMSEIVTGQQYWLLKLANDITHRRIKRALLDLDRQASCRPSKLVRILFGDDTPSILLQSHQLDCMKFYNLGLDESQKAAVHFALSQKELAVIHGPPGTGKTTTLVEVILHLVQQGLKVLACAPSNVAVDNLVERLVAEKVKVVRLGHPARVLSGIQQYSLDAMLSRCDEHLIIDDLRQEINKSMASQNKQNQRGEGGERSWRERKQLMKELQEREKKAVKGILANASVTLGTLTSVTPDGPLKHLPSDHFSVVVIDECSQALEAACWIPLLAGEKCILAGDHLQLPPTIVSEKAARDGLSVTLMERILKLHGNAVVKMLFVQYRMHGSIMHWASKELYDNKLIAHSSVASHLLCDLPGVRETEETKSPLLLIDTAGCDMFELELENEESQGNEGEADLVDIHVRKLISSGVKSTDIGVISPYNLQVDLIKLRLQSCFPALEIKSVDGFQGREKEAIVLSLVRSNKKGEVGFLADLRRINVAVTRARRHLTIICNTETVSQVNFLNGLVEYVMTNGEVRSAHQYETELGGCSVNRPEHLQFKSVTTTSSRGAGVKKKQGEKRTKAVPTAPRRSKAGEEKGPQNSHRGSSDGMLETSQMRELVKRDIEEKIGKFVTDEVEKEYSFPSTLSSYERKLVHELCEKIGLLHESMGEGKERRIVIGKKKNEGKQCFQEVNTDKLDNYEDYNRSVVATQSSCTPEQNPAAQCFADDGSKSCTTCRKLVPTKNYELHSLQCRKAKETLAASGRRKESRVKPTAKLPNTDDLDVLRASVMRADNTCSFQGCKVGITVLGQTCEFCRCRFCFSHALPEIHGCGDAAKAHARSKVLRGGAAPQRKEDPAKKAYLQKKLEEKLGEMSQKRKAKKK